MKLLSSAISVLLLGTALLLLPATVSRAVLLSPVITNAATGRTYAMLHMANWEVSELQARRLGGHLATVRSQAEQNWLYNTFANYGAFTKLMWIGLSDQAREGLFLWNSGEPTAYTHWAPGEPNSTSEPFIAMYYAGHSAQGRWNDWGDRLTDPIGIRFHGIIEFVPGATTLLVSTGSVWKYLDTGVYPGASWKDPGFNDASWAAGRGQLGYGDSDEATVIGYGGNPNNRHITTYFRHQFVVTNLAAIQEFVVSILRDDGYVAYLNGTEIRRDNMNGGVVGHDWLATAAVTGGDEFAIFHSSAILNPALLVEGTNLLAVEVHQAAPDSTDVSFDCFVLAKTGSLPPVVHVVDPLDRAHFGSTQGIRLEAVADGDNDIASLRFFANGMAANAGTPVEPEITIPNPNTVLADLWAVVTDTAGLSATSVVRTIYFAPELLARGATWKFNDTGNDLGSTWRTMAYDDSAWSSGPSELGYGDNDEATLVSYGNAANKHMTTYFRRELFVPNPAEFTNMVLQLLADDGAIVYLNNVEVARHNLPAGAVGYSTPATVSVCCLDESQFFEFNLSPALFNAGANILAVEVHQASPESSDLSFDLALLGQAADASTMLALQLAPGGLQLSWSANQIGYVLEATDDLTPPIDWQPVEAPVSRDIWAHSSTVTNLSSSMFFRLRRQ